MNIFCQSLGPSLYRGSTVLNFIYFSKSVEAPLPCVGPALAWLRLYNSGAPARAKRAWDRAPYSWNMVNLFSFGCHVTDRAYVRVYRLYRWGREDYQKEGRGVSGVCWQVHIFNIGF